MPTITASLGLTAANQDSRAVYRQHGRASIDDGFGGASPAWYRYATVRKRPAATSTEPMPCLRGSRAVCHDILHFSARVLAKVGALPSTSPCRAIAAEEPTVPGRSSVAGIAYGSRWGGGFSRARIRRFSGPRARPVTGRSAAGSASGAVRLPAAVAKHPG